MAHNRQHICVTCRRACKQPIFAILIECPRYYAFKAISQVSFKHWMQQQLPFMTKISTITIAEWEQHIETKANTSKEVKL